MTTDLDIPPAQTPPRRGPIQFLRDFWVKPIRPEPLALFRICLGLTLFLSTLASIVPYHDRFMGPDGLCVPDGVDPWLRNRMSWTVLRGPVSIPLLEDRLPAAYRDAWVNWANDPQTTYWLLRVWLLATLCMTLGLYTRWSTILTWVLTVSFHYRYIWLLNGGDELARCGVFYLMFAPSGAAWSLDAWLGRSGAGPTLIRPWPVRLMQIQLACLYFFAGVSKLGQDWFDGVAVYWVLNDITLTRFPYAWLPVPLFICRILTWATLVFEIGWPFFVLVSALRPWLLLGGVLFHLGIMVHCEIGWFSPVSVAYYPLFIQAETLRRFFGGPAAEPGTAEAVK